MDHRYGILILLKVDFWEIIGILAGGIAALILAWCLGAAIDRCKNQRVDFWVVIGILGPGCIMALIIAWCVGAAIDRCKQQQGQRLCEVQATYDEHGRSDNPIYSSSSYSHRALFSPGHHGHVVDRSDNDTSARNSNQGNTASNLHGNRAQTQRNHGDTTTNQQRSASRSTSPGIARNTDSRTRNTIDNTEMRVAIYVPPNHPSSRSHGVFDPEAPPPTYEEAVRETRPPSYYEVD